MVVKDDAADPAVDILLFDDDPMEHDMLRSTARRAAAPIRLAFADSETTLRQRLSSFGTDILFCDNHVPPFMDFTESVPLIRDLGYCGPIVVLSSFREALGDGRARENDVAALFDKAQLTPGFLDEMLARHAAPALLRARRTGGL